MTMFIGLDLETTGLSKEDDHVVEVAIVLFDEEKIIEEWSSLVKPPVSIPAFTSQLTGITDEMVKEAPTLDELRATILAKIGDHSILGHFIPFDVGFLQAKGFTLKNILFDTCHLTQAFLLKEASYSLEVLAQKLKLPQPNAHRALDDVKANIHLFWRLAEHVRALEEKEKKVLKPILKKSKWPWAEVLMDVMGKSGGQKITEVDIFSVRESEEHANLAELTKDLNAPFLFEERSHTDHDLLNYALAQKGKTLLVLPYPQTLPLHEDLGILKHPSEYLHEGRFQIFLEKDAFTPEETVLAMKLSLWLLQSKTGEKKEIRLIKEEKELWYDLCCQEGEDGVSFFGKAQRRARDCKVMAVSSYYFLKDRSRKNPLLSQAEHVVLGQVESLVEKLKDAWHIRLGENRFIADLRRLKGENPDHAEIIDGLASKVSILFGFLGMMIRKHGAPNDPYHTLVVETHHLNTTAWNKVKHSAESIEAATAALGDDCKNTPLLEEFTRYLGYLTKILRLGSPILWLTFSNDEQPIVHAFPGNPAEIFKERIWKDIPSLHMFCHHGNLRDDFAFVKKELALPEAVHFKAAEEVFPLPLYYPEKPIKNLRDDTSIHEVVAEVLRWMPERTGDTMILAGASTVAERLFYKLAKPLKEKERKLFVQNLSGGMGKIVKMAEKTAGTNIFVGSESFMDFLLGEEVELSSLILLRLPFANPKDPIQKARAAFYKDPYQDFALPQASLRYQSLLNRFLGNAWKGKKILILDSRISDYEGSFN